MEAVPVRIPGPRRLGFGVDLVHRVTRPVEIDVQPDAEEVLVDHAVDALCDELAVLRRLTRGRGGRRDDPGRLHLGLDRAVLVEVPEEPVVIVADRRDRRDHEPPRAAHLGLAGAKVPVLPQHPVVFLVQADRVPDHDRLADAVAHRGVEVADLTEAVAAELERVGERADEVLADVERCLDVPRRARVAVRNRHLAVARRGGGSSEPAAVVVADLWRTSPSRALKPTRNDHFCQLTRLPSTVKLGPSGCVISSGFRSSRNARRAPARNSPSPGGTGTTPWSSTSRTSPRLRSTSADDALDRPGVAIPSRKGPDPREGAADEPPPRSRVGSFP